MRIIVAGHEARTEDEFIELAIGSPVALWLGVEGESDQDREAREAAAHDILADDPELFDRVSRLAADLSDTVPLRRPRPVRAVAGAGVAA